MLTLIGRQRLSGVRGFDHSGSGLQRAFDDVARKTGDQLADIMRKTAVAANGFPALGTVRI